MHKSQRFVPCIHNIRGIHTTNTRHHLFRNVKHIGFGRMLLFIQISASRDNKARLFIHFSRVCVCISTYFENRIIQRFAANPVHHFTNLENGLVKLMRFAIEIALDKRKNIYGKKITFGRATKKYSCIFLSLVLTDVSGFMCEMNVKFLLTVLNFKVSVVAL